MTTLMLKQVQAEVEELNNNIERVAIQKAALWTKLRPIVEALGFAVHDEEDVVFIQEFKDVIEVKTERFWCGSMDVWYYEIPKHVLESAYPIEAAKGLLMRRQEEALQKQTAAKQAEIRRLSEELRKLQGETNG